MLCYNLARCKKRMIERGEGSHVTRVVSFITVRGSISFWYSKGYLVAIKSVVMLVKLVWTLEIQIGLYSEWPLCTSILDIGHSEFVQCIYLAHWYWILDIQKGLYSDNIDICCTNLRECPMYNIKTNLNVSCLLHIGIDHWTFTLVCTGKTLTFAVKTYVNVQCPTL